MFKLGNVEKWPETWSLDYNTILQLDLCHRMGKWTHLSGGTIHAGDQSDLVIRDNLSKYCLNFGYDTMTTGEKTQYGHDIKTLEKTS